MIDSYALDIIQALGNLGAAALLTYVIINQVRAQRDQTSAQKEVLGLTKEVMAKQDKAHETQMESLKEQHERETAIIKQELQDDLEDLREKVKSQAEQIEVLQAVKDEQTTQIADLKRLTTEQAREIEDLHKGRDQQRRMLETEITRGEKLEKTVAEQNEQIAEQAKQIASQSARIGSLETENAQLKANYASAKKENEELRGLVDGLSKPKKAEKKSE